MALQQAKAEDFQQAEMLMEEARQETRGTVAYNSANIPNFYCLLKDIKIDNDNIINSYLHPQQCWPPL